MTSEEGQGSWRMLRSQESVRKAHWNASSRSLQGDASQAYTWESVSVDAGFGKRYAHVSVINSNKEMYVMGGVSGDHGTGHLLNDVWVSKDEGNSWEFVKPRSPRFSARRGHAVAIEPRGIIFFVLGGFCGKDRLMNDWWSSEHGDVWNPLGDAPWSARHGHAVVMTSNNVLVVLGGHDGNSYLGDVWQIKEPGQQLGLNSWKQSTDKAEWVPRCGHAAVNDRRDDRNVMYVLGGFYAEKATGHVRCFNDVWRSEDTGATWTLVVENAPWSGRYQHSSEITTHGHMFVIGGLGVDLERSHDVWRSHDGGKNWQAVSTAAPWAARYEHTSLINPENTMFVLGGVSTGSNAFRDIWRSERTCADEVECSEVTPVCRDGTQENFRGIPEPVCVGVCDRKIFDKCKEKEMCEVQEEKPVCVDPCETQECDKGYVCEVAARDAEYQGKVLDNAKSYCLSCSNAQTKITCAELRACRWSGSQEACVMRCSALKTKDRCASNDACKWKDDACAKAG
eukprot:TRINITY_DN20842_c0_g1_i1.p1 TRINITY_DN20842_c0_g1~~TRINITY_DN20842_c0_g1_i1.p1  ORF type:complete len:509 (+),score=64.47 TRINITY_DN20842_c0_g1_i1:3-1529(+)